MNGDWRYYFTDYFPSDWHCWRGELTRLDLGVLDDISNRIGLAGPHAHDTPQKDSKPKNKPVAMMLTFPFDTESEGPLVLEPQPEWKLFHHMDTSINILWTKSKDPGRNLNITSVGVRQGPTTTSKTRPAYLALDTPYINLPNDIYDRVSMVARPQRVDMGRGMQHVDVIQCNSTFALPNVILEFNDGQDEMVIKPEQYILKVNDALGGPFAGKCVLLLAKGAELAIGWAALRGRTVWLDWVNARTGFTV